MKKYKYAIIGSGGFIAPRHIQAIHDTGGEVILTCDNDPTKMADFVEYRDMFQHERMKDVDAIIICTPNYLHSEMVRDALRTGKRVLCEKPLTIFNDFIGLDGVFVVLQLRYHDLIPEIIKTLIDNKKNEIVLMMKVYRDENWWQSWRGDEAKSGGILIGIGIHMIDVLIFLLGNEYKIIESFNSKKLCTGVIQFPTALVKYHVEILNSREGQTRSFIINDKNFELCDKDNLSFSGYHHRVYEEFISGNGIPLSEAKKSIELVLKLKNYEKN
jgi:UDP-N-acetyl-2-amino-2-deoxyglucuronate dehydrogenase